MPRIVEYLLRWAAVLERKRAPLSVFIIPDYRGDGRFYQKSFSRVGLTLDLADQISFVELVDEPTSGTSKLVANDLKTDHLRRLSGWIEAESTRLVFLPSSVGALMHSTGAFPWIAKKARRAGCTANHLRLWGWANSVPVYWHYHFSVYGKFEEEKARQLADISDLVHAVFR